MLDISCSKRYFRDNLGKKINKRLQPNETAMNKENVLRTWSPLKHALSYQSQQKVCTAFITACLYKGVDNSC